MIPLGKLLIKISMVEVLTILAFASPPHSEVAKIVVDALQCIYCNPSYYPHGWTWYGIMEFIFLFAKTPKTITITWAIINMVVMILLANYKPGILFYSYWFGSMITNFVIPQNYPIIYLIAASGFFLPRRLNLLFLPLAIITKLPVGAPISDWQFIFHTSLNIVTNWQDDYGVLVVLWLLFMSYNIERVRIGAKIMISRLKK